MTLAITLLLAFAGRVSASGISGDAALSGIVRDIHGVPQMGALVQLLSADASIIATAFTDNHGRYLIPTVSPGQYQLRATAAFFVPSSRRNVHLTAGAQAIVNLTMSTLYEAETWLPAQKRSVDEAADDWKWALRSSANRPLLRLVDDADGAVVSSSAEHHRRTVTQTRVSVISGDGDFGQGGTHQVVVIDRTVENGDGAIFRADVGGPRIPYPVLPAAEVSAGYERRSPFGGNTRLVTSYLSHPEIIGGTSAGAQVMQLASTQEFKLGDMIVIDAGSLVQAQHLTSTRISSQPFARVSLRPDSGFILTYRYATGRDLQSSDDLDHLKPALRLLTDAVGHPLSTKGSHHEVSVDRKLGSRTVLQVAAFVDHTNHSQLHGSGLLDRTDLSASPVLADPTTGTFTLASAAYSGRGASISVVEPVTHSLAVYVDYDLGTALVHGLGDTTPLTEVQKGTTTRVSYAVNGSVRGKIIRTGTTLNAQYNWQPERNLTPVNAYNTTDRSAYLGFRLRQRLYLGRWLPEGLDAVVEATNLLEQGYQPVISNDGRVLFLAQAPRAIQGGFAFNF